ncbi:hypothetical protein L3081_24885 [Colwellia sp. MSW7]|uniref:Pili assembly chaperone n=1 Tax=Colwellia maritima TaxID=2912588 RepID=A0ABS9X9A5_9GAMM|nr:hypothetical protein [Colwellia maritima]MCI2286061.1 hypothetical protein [Colwellia maritima]
MSFLPKIKAALNIKTVKTLLLISIATLFGINMAILGSGGEAFLPIYSEIEGWLDGVPGKIVAILAFGAAMVNVLKQNYLAALGAFVGCMLMANAVSIINFFLGLGI